MKTYPTFPQDKTCLICGTNDDKECLLVPDITTVKDGLCIAQITHLECIVDNIFIQDNFMFVRLKEQSDE